MLTSERIALLERLLASATPGPWECCDGPIGYQHRLYGPGRDAVCDVIVTRDATLIAEAINALPALLQLARAYADAPRVEINSHGDEVTLIAEGSGLDSLITGVRVDAMHGQTVALVPVTVKEGKDAH